MKIIIAGAGKVGATLTRSLSADGHDITLIDNKKEALTAACELYDVMGTEGSCATLETLTEAGAAEADLLIAVTNADEINLLCCVTARRINPKIHTIVRIRNAEYTAQILEMRDIFGISLIVNPEYSAAVEIERLLRYPGFLARESFAKGKVELVEFRLDEKSPLAGLQLNRISSVLKARVLICAVMRGSTITLPRGDFELKADDRIYMTAPAHELGGILRPVNPREVEYEVRPGAPAVEVLRRGIEVIFIDGLDAQVRETPVLPFLDVAEVHAEVAADEPFRAGDQNLHYFTMLGMPFSSFWMYSSEAIFAFVSARSSRRVLSELNSLMVARFVSPSLKYLS